MSEKALIDRAQGHLVIAAVRVLSHRERRPPSPEEVAELLGAPPEWVRVAVRRLIELGALGEVADAYGARIEVATYLKLEELTLEAGGRMEEELRSFSARSREKQEALKKQFDSDFRAGQKKRFSQLEDDLKKFRGDKGPRTNMWGEPIESEDE
jgi:hypothetical protein